MTADSGDRTTVEVLWVDPATGDPVAATTQLVYTAPDGTQTTIAHASLTNPSTGLYQYVILHTALGVWTYTFTASGAHVETETGYFYVSGKEAFGGPCEPWISASEVFDLAPASDIAAADRDYALAGDVAEAATKILYSLMAHPKYTGICRDVIRPRRRSASWVEPAWWAWQHAWGSCGCGSLGPDSCSCSSGSELALPGDPVLGVAEVRVDGAVVSSTLYELRDGKWLARTDGNAWPSCQDLDADPASELDTFQVTYYYGIPAEEDGRLAAKRLAGELYLAAQGARCKLPQRIRSIVRQGIEVGFIDPQEFLDDGRTGLYEVDLFLSAGRWSAANRGTVVASPDFLPTVRRS